MGLLQKLFRGDDGPALGPPTYSNDAVIARIEEAEDVSRETARAWFDEMLVFLDLCAASKEVLSPPPDVDKAWHAFLLHSRDYEAYCNERFGRVIHHQPTGEPDPQAYRRAYERRDQYGYGTPDLLMWAVPAGVVAGSGEDEREQDRSGASGAGGTAHGVGADGGSGDGGSGDGGSGDGGFFGGGSSGDGGSSGGGGGGGGDGGGGASCGGGGCGGGGGS